MKWRPIKTAPKDGTWILACVPDADPFYVETRGGYSSAPESIHWAVYHPNSRGKEEWRDQYGIRRPHATHWQPLPAPPMEARPVRKGEV